MAKKQQPRRETLQSKEYRYTALFESAPEGGYVVFIPSLGVTTEGDTLEEARAMAKDAVEGYLESLIKEGEEVPVEEGSFTEQVAVTVTGR